MFVGECDWDTATPLRPQRPCGCFPTPTAQPRSGAETDQPTHSTDLLPLPQCTSRGVPFLRPTTAAASPRHLSHHLTWFVPASPSRCTFEASRQGGVLPGPAQRSAGRQQRSLRVSPPGSLAHSHFQPCPRGTTEWLLHVDILGGRRKPGGHTVLSPVKCRYKRMR